jgi:hypothetical protein
MQALINPNNDESKTERKKAKAENGLAKKNRMGKYSAAFLMSYVAHKGFCTGEQGHLERICQGSVYVLFTGNIPAGSRVE